MSSATGLSTALTIDSRSNEAVRMLFPEDLARIRCHELHEEARRYRLAHRIAAERWWRWLANYAARRASRHALG